MGSEATVGRLGGHKSIQNRTDNKPQQRYYGVQDVVMIITWQETNVQPLVQIFTNMAKRGHFNAYCFTKPVHAVSTGNMEEKISSFL